MFLIKIRIGLRTVKYILECACKDLLAEICTLEARLFKREQF